MGAYTGADPSEMFGDFSRENPRFFRGICRRTSAESFTDRVDGKGMITLFDLTLDRCGTCVCTSTLYVSYWPFSFLARKFSENSCDKPPSEFFPDLLQSAFTANLERFLRRTLRLFRSGSPVWSTRVMDHG